MKSRQLYLLLGLSALVTPAAISCANQDQPTTPATAPAAPAVAPAPKPARFENEIADFEKADRRNTPATGAVIFTGSSSVRMWETVAADFPELIVMNRGFGGSHMEDNVRFVDRIITPYKPKLVVVYAGTNDIADGKDAQRVFNDFVEYADKIHAKLPKTRVAYMSINPSTSRWAKEPIFLEANRLIADYVKQNDGKKGPLGYVDSHTGLLKPDGTPHDGIFLGDGLHLNKQGYTELAAIVRPQVLKFPEAQAAKKPE